MPWKKLLAWATGQIHEALRQKLAFVLEEGRDWPGRIWLGVTSALSAHWPTWGIGFWTGPSAMFSNDTAWMRVERGIRRQDRVPVLCAIYSKSGGK
jgi:hypothetical protein